MSTAVLHRNGLTITTQVPLQQTVPGTYGPAMTSQPLTSFETFFRGQPKALGKAQIVIGCLALLLGFVLTIMLNWAPYYPYEVHDNCQRSLFMLWGPITHIIVGCLGFVQEKRLSGCGVKTILVMNVISAVTAGICIILLLCLLFQQPNGYWPYGLPGQASNFSTVLIPMTALSKTEATFTHCPFLSNNIKHS
ncbi:membrane-spanning 4-domains subfamily A member 18-like [Colossoma macropomum]|uniref:membrane-spanning 4-domains subfamily A member 18-like n=1 Tax=Colossoma macropomum TaxID=42526 RepID=UPI0018655448|nr:membrane-spanning 4-domains subfamily A member 18-like [Colossoma macropomum]